MIRPDAPRCALQGTAAQAGSINSERAWLNGQFILRQSLCLPVGDAGFVLGATVSEQLRTFNGRLFLPELHGKRLAESLAIVGIVPTESIESLFQAAAELATHNHALSTQALDAAGLHAQAGGDLGLVIFLTPGNQPAQHAGRGSAPFVAIHTFPLAFSIWARAYTTGLPLRSVAVRQVPEACWPLQAKVRSRLHYFLADREANAAEQGARAVVCHSDGRISETSTANIAIVRGNTISTPPPTDALVGVSLGYTQQLAQSQGLMWQQRSLRQADLENADEILLTSTPNCLLPATRYNGQPVGTGRPGPIFQRLLGAWSQSVGVDIAAQACRCTDNGLTPPKGVTA